MIEELRKLIDHTLSCNKSLISCCLKIKNDSSYYTFLLNETCWLDKYNPSIIERLYCVINNINAIDQIIRCGQKLKFKNWEDGYNKYCKANCKCNVIDTASARKNMTSYEKSQLFEKTRRTNLKRYGTHHPMQSNQIKNKCMDHFKENYSYVWPFQSPEIQKKAKEKIKERYGEDRSEIFKKVKATNLKKYGVEMPLQSQDIRKKIKQTVVDRYGVSNPSQIHIDPVHLEILLDPTLFKQTINGLTFQEIKNILPVDQTTIADYCFKYNCRNLIKPDRSSFLESKIKDFCDQNHITYQQNTHRIIPPFELDFYFPEASAAIECHGLYWHSEIGRNTDKLYHYNKYLLCKEKGIDLYQYFEDEINLSFDIIKSKILYINNIHNGNRIGARTLIIDYLKKYSDEVRFYKANHIQGPRPDRSCTIGAWNSENDLVGCLSFKSNKNKSELEIIRFATDISNIYSGLFSKMLNWYLNAIDFQGEVLSWSDNRHSNGYLYQNNGFEIVREQKPGYFVTDYQTRWRREHFMKNKIKQRYPEVDLTKTEWQLEQQLGYDRIWDAGKTLWRKIRK